MIRRLDAIARMLMIICILLLFGYIHMMSVYYPGSPHAPDAVHVVPVSYKGGVIYVQAAQQLLLNELLLFALGAGVGAISSWGLRWVISRWRSR